MGLQVPSHVDTQVPKKLLYGHIRTYLGRCLERSHYKRKLGALKAIVCQIMCICWSRFHQNIRWHRSLDISKANVPYSSHGPFLETKGILLATMFGPQAVCVHRCQRGKSCSRVHRNTRGRWLKARSTCFAPIVFLPGGLQLFTALSGSHFQAVGFAGDMVTPKP